MTSKAFSFGTVRSDLSTGFTYGFSEPVSSPLPAQLVTPQVKKPPCIDTSTQIEELRFTYGFSEPVSSPLPGFTYGFSEPVSSPLPGFTYGFSEPVSSPLPGFTYGFSEPVSSPLPGFTYGFSEPVSSPLPAQPVTPQVKKPPCIDTSTQTEELHMNKFKERLKELLQSGEFNDVTLNVKGEEFKVHKIILAAHSPVFAAMMKHDTKEKATGIVNIEDGDPDAFADFLHCIYSGNTQNLNSENVVDLYTLADKYQINELRQICGRYMIDHISLDTFCDIMALSLRYHEKELIEVATKYFLKNSIEISKSAKWLIFLKENLVAGNELFLKSLESKTQ